MILGNGLVADRRWKMRIGFSSKRILRYGLIALIVAVILYIGWIDWRGWVTSSICTGVGLVLFAAAMFYFRQRDVKADREIAQRIKAEFPPESQSEVFDIYYGLKIKELEYLFTKVLDDAQGNIQEVRKLAALAQSIGWKAFLENRW
jgi:hypothetical protein